MRFFRLVKQYLRTEFLKWLAWRSFAFTLVVNVSIMPLIGLAVWSAALPGRDVLTYFVALLFVRMLTISQENHTVSELIYQGEFADHLLRPHPVMIAPLGENLAMRAWHLIIAAPLLALLLVVLPLAFAGRQVLLALPALVLAALLRFLYTYALAAVAFWTERAHSAVGFGNTLIFLLGGEAAPFAFLPESVKPWAALLPFRAMSGFPAEVAAGWLTPRAVVEGYVVQVLWVALVGGLCALVWRAGIKRFTAVGG